MLTTDGSGNLSFAAPASTLTLVDESSTSTSINLLTETLKITGGTGIATALSGDTMTISFDNNAVFNGLDMNGTELVLDADADTSITADTDDTIHFKIGGNDRITFTTGVIDVKNDGSQSEIRLYCESSNAHYAQLQAPAHSDFSGNQTYTLPSSAGTLVGQGDTGTVSNAMIANSSITIGSDAINLGASRTDINGLTSLDVDNVTVDGNTISTTNTNGDLVLDPNGSGDVDVNSSKIINVTDPTAAQHAATKAYVDSVANGLDVKDSVRLAPASALAAVTYNNGNGTLTADANGALTVDGVTVSVDDRILVKDQASAVQNGIYKVTATGGASAVFVLTRTPDADTAAELTGGTFFFAEEGTANADNGYVSTHNGTPTFGSTNITFAQFSGAGQISAGNALTKTGNTLNVAVDDSSIEVNSDALRVKASGITNAMLAGSIAISKLSGAQISFSDDSSTVSNIALGETIAVAGGEGVDATISGQTLTIAGEDATASNKGVASFSSDNFTVASGAVTVTTIDGGTF